MTHKELVAVTARALGYTWKYANEFPEKYQKQIEIYDPMGNFVCILVDAVCFDYKNKFQDTFYPYPNLEEPLGSPAVERDMRECFNVIITL